MDEIMRQHSMWFDASPFFKTRVLSGLYTGPGGIYFVTSERCPIGPRLYTVRQARVGGVETVGPFQGHLTAAHAKAAARRHAGTVERTPMALGVPEDFAFFGMEVPS